MFPDSEIAKDYQHKRTKLSIDVVQHGIVPVIRSLNKKDFENMPFSFIFDETTTSQVKKRYDAYITYFCKVKSNSYVVTIYCGSVFVGKCSAENL